MDSTHEITRYVDDSKSNIRIKDSAQIEAYIKTYLDLIYNHFTMNYYTVDKSEIKITLIELPQYQIKIGNESTHCDGQVKILGHLFNSESNLMASINDFN